MTTELPTAVDLDDMARQLEADTQKINGALHEARATGDPGVSIEQAAHARTRKLIQELKVGSLTQLTQLRDTVDDLMRALSAKSLELEDSLNEFSHMVQTSCELAAVIQPKVDEQAKIVGSGLKPTPGKTVTSR